MPMKAFVQLIMAVLAAVIPGFIDGEAMGFAQWVNVGVLAAGALVVYLTTNLYNSGVWAYAKAIGSGIATVGVLLIAALSDGGVSTAETIQMVIAVLAPFAVGLTNPDSGMATASVGAVRPHAA